MAAFQPYNSLGGPAGLAADPMLNGELASEVATYVLALQGMPASAAVAGYGLTPEATAHVHGYIQGSLYTRLADDSVLERQVYDFLEAKASPPTPVFRLWKAMAVKAMISHVLNGGSLADVEFHPDHQRFLTLAGWVPAAPVAPADTLAPYVVQGGMPGVPFVDAFLTGMNQVPVLPASGIPPADPFGGGIAQCIDNQQHDPQEHSCWAAQDGGA